MSGFLQDYGVIGWLVIGLLAGAIARLLMPGRDPGGCLVTIVLGIGGAVLAGWLGQKFWFGPDWRAGFLAAVVGAFIILLVYRLVLGRRRR